MGRARMRRRDAIEGAADLLARWRRGGRKTVRADDERVTGSQTGHGEELSSVHDVVWFGCNVAIMLEHNRPRFKRRIAAPPANFEFEFAAECGTLAP